MPLYTYQCQSCGKEHEVIRKFSDPPLKKCPACGNRVKKLIHLTSFHLKGGGWYKDGYASVKSNAGNEAPAKKEPEKKTEKKTEKKD